MSCQIVEGVHKGKAGSGDGPVDHAVNGFIELLERQKAVAEDYVQKDTCHGGFDEK